MMSSLQSNAATQQQTSYMAYNPDTGRFDLRQSISFQFPDADIFGPGPYPLFIWTPGAFESYKDPLSNTFVAGMAARGFVAASVEYGNTSANQTCRGYLDRAQGVFEAARGNSAVAVLCTIHGVDCGKGIVASGVSEGGILSILAKNYAGAVRAAFVMSVSDTNQVPVGIDIDLSSCLDKGSTAIPADRLVIVNGEDDPIFGGQAPLERVSGYTCPAGSNQCWNPAGNGAGWYIVRNTQTSDGDAGHCYYLARGCTFSPPEVNWRPPSTYNWSLAANLDWLATLGTSRVFSPAGQ